MGEIAHYMRAVSDLRAEIEALRRERDDEVRLHREARALYEAEVEALRRELDEALAAIREFVDEAVNGDHFCGGVPTDWTDRFIDLLRETS